MDELIKALYLTKEDSRLMGSMLKKFHVLSSEGNIFTYKNKDINFCKFFDENFEYSIVYCKDIEGLLNDLHFYSNVNLDWWLFIVYGTAGRNLNTMKKMIGHCGWKII